MASNIQQKLVLGLKKLFQPFVDAATDEELLFQFFHWLGWDVQAILGTNSQLFMDSIADIVIAINELQTLIDNPPKTLTDFINALSITAEASQAIQNLSGTVSGSSITSQQAKQLPSDVLEKLFQLYLFSYNRRAYHFFEAIKVIHDEPVNPIVNNDDVVVRFQPALPKFNFSRIPDFLNNPVNYLKVQYPAYVLTTRSEAIEFAKDVFVPISKLLSNIGVVSFVGRGEGPLTLSVEEEDRIDSMMTSYYSYFDTDTSTTSSLGATFYMVSQEDGGPGVMIAPFGALNFQKSFGNWNITANATANIKGVFIKSDGTITIESDGGLTEMFFDISALYRSETGKKAFGSTTGSRIELGGLLISSFLNAGNELDFGLLAQTQEASLILARGDGDGFINKMIPENGLEIKFDLGLGWSQKKGLYFLGSASLEKRIAVHKTILGFLNIDYVNVGLQLQQSGNIATFADIEGSIDIGPVNFSVQRVGLESNLSFPEEGGNLGKSDLKVGFKPPNGIGISVDATAVKGAGFLSIDHVNQRYSGALSLTIVEKIDLLAYGVLVTKMPDGSNGFSMVAVMSVVFNPTIPLAFGFTLNGLGGLLGLHRSANAEYLRSGLIDGSVGDLMFPVNPAPRLMQIISNLESAFPVHKDRFVFGPAAKIGWGAPSLITIDLALIIELPAPVRLYILGVVRALLPDEKKPILQLQINFLGVIDFAKKSVAFDAALFDSKLLTFKLSGTMAFRMIGGSNPYFLMTVGGFHPAFKIPPLNLPAQQRLGLSLVNSGNFKLGATTYFAITSNSVQFGAAIALSASLGVFAITGGFGFDVLIIFNPFSFVAAMSAGLAISGKLPVIKIRIRRILRISVRIEWRSINLASVSLSGTIQGPSEWIVKGKATFSALGTSYSFDVNKQWGKKEHITIPSIDLMPRLLAELDKDINWQIESGKAAKQSVVIREIPEGTFVFNSSGQLQIQQNLLPLKLNIEKYGNAKPKSDNRFEITDIKLGNPQRFMQASLVDTKDFFAPGEYKNYSKAQKLSLPAFQKFNNGVQAKAPNAAGAFDYGNYTQHRVMVYEEKYIDTTGDGNDNTAIGENSLKSSLNTTLNSALEAETANLFLKGNAAAKYRRKNNLVQFTRTDHSFLVNEERYAIVDCRDLTIHDIVGESFWGTLMEAEEEMEILLKNNPALAGQITVIAEFEMAA